jgi:hypothetical protein
MKKSDLRRIIQEEIQKVLAEAPQVAPEKTETDVETKPTTPTRRRTVTPPNPKTLPNPKAKEIAEKIAQRFKQGKK